MSRGLIFKTLILLLLALSLSGCWDRRELKTLAIVSGVGIDQEGKSGKIQLTAQVIKPDQIKSPAGGGSNGGGGGGGSAFWNVKSTDDTVFGAVRRFTLQSSRKLYFPDNKVIMFGRTAAENGVRKYLDFFTRDPETRGDVWIAVTQNRASEVLDIKPQGLDKIQALNISDIIKDQAATSQISAVNLQEFITGLMSKTTAPVAPIIEISGKAKEIRLSSTAVFKKDKLAGRLNQTETRGLLWVTGKVKSGIVDVNCPGDDGRVSLEIIKAGSKIIPEVKNGSILIKVKIKEEGNLGSQMCTADLTELQKWRELEHRQSLAINNEVRAAIKKAQELNTDIFGFGDAVHRKYPQLWKDLEKRWDDFFPDLEVTVSVESKLRLSGVTTKPIKSE